MTVFVDSMNAKYGRMTMCHMVSDADNDDELHAMASQIGVARRWHQKAGTPHSHYDICLSKKKLALELGAVEISRQDLARILAKKRSLFCDTKP